MFLFFFYDTTSRILIGDKACDVIVQNLKAVFKAVGLRLFSAYTAFKPANTKVYLI